MPLEVIAKSRAVKLSICISTRNRAAFIGETLESIIAQATDDCEIVVFDGASTDNTEQVVSAYGCRFSNLRYFRQERNDGADRGFDHAVTLASGEYCWLMPDDDLLKPGAVAAVLAAIRKEYSLIVVNVEYCDFELSQVRHYSDLELDIDSDREFAPADMDKLFETCWRLIRYTGSIAIRRSVWLERNREMYFGTYWMDVGVIFQERLPSAALVMAKPYISVRMENQSWLSNYFRIFCVNWPALVASLALSESIKNGVAGEAWTQPKFLLMSRAAGQYSLAEYRQHVQPHLGSLRKRLLPFLIALLPGMILNTYLVSFHSVFRRPDGRSWLLMLTESRFNLQRKWRSLIGA